MEADLSVSIECRDIRHSWEKAGDTVLIQQEGQVKHFQRRLCCSRCETVRIDEYRMSSFSLARVRTKYKYPDGYRVPGGMPVERARWILFSNADMVPLAEAV